MNILYIEDNLQDSTLVKRYISTTPHHLVTVSRLEDVDLDMESIDLILLDILIDGKPAGLDYLKTIRDMGIDCPVIAITALTLPNQLASYENAGIETVLAKPFEIAQLADVIACYA